MEPRAYGPFPYTPITERPEIKWPGGARIALWVAPNIEFFPLDEKVFMGAGMVPDVLSWSHREYGNRVGIWRIMEAWKSMACPAPWPSTPKCASASPA